MIDGLCQRYSCPPSVILQEDADYVLGLVQLVEMGRVKEKDG